MLVRTVPYATLEQFKASIYSDDAEGVTQKMLERASNKVDELLFNAVYDLDEVGIATDPGVRAAIMEATCAQAAYYDEIGDVSGASAGGGGSLGPLSLPNRTAGAGGSVRRAQTSPEAAGVLRRAGLLSSITGGAARVLTKAPPVGRLD